MIEEIVFQIRQIELPLVVEHEEFSLPSGEPCNPFVILALFTQIVKTYMFFGNIAEVFELNAHVSTKIKTKQFILYNVLHALGQDFYFIVGHYP